MDSFVAWLIGYFLLYGIPVLGAAIIIGSNAIPSGAIVLVIAAGAFAYAGDFILWQLLLWVWFFNVLGDISSYWLWRAFGPTIRKKFKFSRHRLTLGLKKSSQYLEKYGFASVFITRFPLAGLGPPMNILSGLSNYSYLYFMLAIIPGDLIYSAVILGLGYWFGDAWESASNLVNQYSQWTSSLVALTFVLWLLIRQARSHSRRKPPKIAVEE